MKDYTDDLTRRNFVNLVAIAAAGTTVGGLMMMGCKPDGESGGGTKTTEKPATGGGECKDLSALTDEEKKTRDSLQYKDISADSAKNCGNCNLFTADAYKSAACGGCKVMKGPVMIAGHCTAWVAKS